VVSARGHAFCDVRFLRCDDGPAFEQIAQPLAVVTPSGAPSHEIDTFVRSTRLDSEVALSPSDAEAD
jgi:hypothetical protein